VWVFGVGFLGGCTQKNPPFLGTYPPLPGCLNPSCCASHLQHALWSGMGKRVVVQFKYSTSPGNWNSHIDE